MKTYLNYFKSFVLCSILIFSFTACDDNDDKDDDALYLSVLKGVYVLNQGSEGKNSAGLSFYSGISSSQSYYFDIFQGKLGDTGQDVLIYGTKMYISVSKSSYINVFDLRSNRVSWKTIKVVDDNNEGREPRSLAAYDGKVYASTYDGHVVRIDTLSLSIDAVTAVGPNPEGIAAANGKLFVANSDGLNYLNGYVNGYMSVIDIASFKETDKLTCGLNPGVVVADKYGDIYVSCLGDYYLIPASFQKVNSQTNAIETIEGVQMSNFTIDDDICYFYNTVYDGEGNPMQTFGKFNVSTETMETGSYITDDTKIGTAYGIGVDPVTKEVYLSDTDYLNPGMVYVFNTNGKLSNSFEAGVNPCQFAFF